MEKFLQNHSITKGLSDGGDCFLIVVTDESNRQVEAVFCYCMFDVLRVIRYYIQPDGKLLYAVTVTKV